jgi:hypothetical protein
MVTTKVCNTSNRFNMEAFTSMVVMTGLSITGTCFSHRYISCELMMSSELPTKVAAGGGQSLLGMPYM